jgi:hypothetical protein
MLNNAIAGVGEGAAKRRQQGIINDREAERIALERDMHRQQGERADKQFKLSSAREDRMEADGARRYDLQEKRENRMLEQATKPTYQWTSGGVKQTAHSLEDFTSMVQQNPADDTDGGSDLEMTGQNEHGISFRQRVKIPKSVLSDENAKKSAATAIKSFAEMTGSVKAAAPTVMTTPGGQEFIVDNKGRPIKGASAPDPGHTTTTVKQEAPSPFAPPGTPPITTTNRTTRVPNVPHGTERGTKRIRVKTADGKTGTMDASEKLPEGWSVIE